jgi:abnormal spindle-like microcephaly-associated protein
VLKVITLIFVLDHLKSMVDGPCLFREVQTLNLEILPSKNSPSKSSLEVAQKMTKLCLAGEGDIGRHLQSITKVQLSFRQYPLDGFQFEIQNLAIDFRDGVRLTRLVEILGGRDDCSQNLRWPANGVSQRTQNLSIALAAIQEAGVGLSYSDGSLVTAHQIETGDREKTLFVLWRLIGKWKLPKYLENVNLVEEIRTLKELLRLREGERPNVEVSKRTRNIR